LFEWLGRNALGKRVGLGRSQEFRMQGDRTRKPRPSGDEAAPRAPAPNGFEQFFAMQKYQDARRDVEEARKERANERQAGLLKLQKRLESRERMQDRALKARQAKAQAEAAAQAAEAEPPALRLNEEAVAALVHRKLAEQLELVSRRQGGGNEMEIPKWLRALGLDEDTLSVAKPFVKSQLANLPVLLAKLGANGANAPTESPLPAPYVPKGPKATKFVPKGGTD